jgi:hypothetical protein
MIITPLLLQTVICHKLDVEGRGQAKKTLLAARSQVPGKWDPKTFKRDGGRLGPHHNSRDLIEEMNFARRIRGLRRDSHAGGGCVWGASAFATLWLRSGEYARE